MRTISPGDPEAVSERSPENKPDQKGKVIASDRRPEPEREAARFFTRKIHAERGNACTRSLDLAERLTAPPDHDGAPTKAGGSFIAHVVRVARFARAGKSRDRHASSDGPKNESSRSIGRP